MHGVVLQEPAAAELAETCGCPGGMWHTLPWFKEVWFAAAENQQGAASHGAGVSGVTKAREIVGGGGTAARQYKAMLAWRHPPLTDQEHLAWYLILLRSAILGHGDAPPPGGKISGPSDNLNGLDRRGLNLIQDSPLAQPPASVVQRLSKVLSAPLIPHPSSLSRTRSVSTSSKAPASDTSPTGRKSSSYSASERSRSSAADGIQTISALQLANEPCYRRPVPGGGARESDHAFTLGGDHAFTLGGGSSATVSHISQQIDSTVRRRMRSHATAMTTRLKKGLLQHQQRTPLPARLMMRRIMSKTDHEIFTRRPPSRPMMMI